MGITQKMYRYKLFLYTFCIVITQKKLEKHWKEGVEGLIEEIEEGMKRVRLTNPGQLQRLLSRVINDTLNDNVPFDKKLEKSRVLGYLMNIMLKCMEISDLEKRVTKLEDTAAKEVEKWG